MITTDALPAKATRYQCAECGLTAPAPIVVCLSPENPASRTGRCSNRPACARRKLRNLTLAKQEPANG